jgi:hypothetical protein
VASAYASILLALALGFVWQEQEKPVEAWWLNATFTPSQTEYESLGVKDINPKWIKFTALTYSLLPPDAKPDLAWMRREGFVFQVDNYFKRPGVVDRELSGVFEDEAGRKGRFLLVLERTDGQRWKVAFLHEAAGEAGFSVFVRRAVGLYWSTCMQCDEFARLRMAKGAFRLDTAP